MSDDRPSDLDPTNPSSLREFTERVLEFRAGEITEVLESISDIPEGHIVGRWCEAIREGIDREMSPEKAAEERWVGLVNFSETGVHVGPSWPEDERNYAATVLMPEIDKFLNAFGVHVVTGSEQEVSLSFADLLTVGEMNLETIEIDEPTTAAWGMAIEAMAEQGHESFFMSQDGQVSNLVLPTSIDGVFLVIDGTIASRPDSSGNGHNSIRPMLAVNVDLPYHHQRMMDLESPEDLSS